ncbi:hypothetical protein [Methanobrevibacter cuticularis]|nr:hypothetical protein [Methanobrevibacter cuticularis]
MIKNPSEIISLWLRTFSTIEYLDLWEKLNNPNFKPHICEGFKIESAKQWREANPDKKGNIRDHATIEQLIVLSNMEGINVLLVREEIHQSERIA